MHVHDDPKIYTGRAVYGGGKTQRVPFELQGGAEGGSPNWITMDAGDGKYARHACREY